jgi:hypothetical protein
LADEPVHLREVLFEFIPVGKYIKVIALDPETLVEITVVGDRKAPQKELQRIAIQKLKYVLRRRQGAAKNVPRTPGSPTDFEA